MRPATAHTATVPDRTPRTEIGRRPRRCRASCLSCSRSWPASSPSAARWCACRRRTRPTETIAISDPMARNWSRPTIVDRNGQLLASDVATPSLYADPKLVIDRDEVVERLRTVLPDLDERELLRQLGEEGRRFVWIRRGLTPRLAQQIHDLGLPGLAFRKELRRVYPAGQMAPHCSARSMSTIAACRASRNSSIRRTCRSPCWRPSSVRASRCG